VAHDHRPPRAQPLEFLVRDTEAFAPLVPRGRLLHLPGPHRRVLHPWHPGGNRVNSLSTTAVPSGASSTSQWVGRVGLLFLQAHTGDHKLPPPPPSTYYNATSAGRLPDQTFHARCPMARHPPSSVHGRLSLPLRLLPRRTPTTAPRRDPTRPSGLVRQPPKRSLDANARGSPLGAHHRPTLGRVPRPKNQATAASQASVHFTWSRGLERSVATSLATRGIRRKIQVPLPRHSTGAFLSTQTTRRVGHTVWLWRTRSTNA
jgi:hypothetical protein